MNAIIQTLIFSNFLFEAGFGFFMPVFAVFITDQIAAGDLAVAGYAVGIYWILKSIMQIPIGRLLDRVKGEWDDFWALLCGHFIMGLVVLLYMFVHSPVQLYLLQVLLAFGGALSVPSWYAMFTRHIDRLKEGFEWSINSSLSFGLGTGGAGIIGGILAKQYGFEIIFLLGAILVWISTLFLVVLRRYIWDGKRPPIPKLPFPL